MVVMMSNVLKVLANTVKELSTSVKKSVKTSAEGFREIRTTARNVREGARKARLASQSIGVAQWVTEDYAKTGKLNMKDDAYTFSKMMYPEKADEVVKQLDDAFSTIEKNFSHKTTEQNIIAGKIQNAMFPKSESIDPKIFSEEVKGLAFSRDIEKPIRETMGKLRERTDTITKRFFEKKAGQRQFTDQFRTQLEYMGVDKETMQEIQQAFNGKDLGSQTMAKRLFSVVSDVQMQREYRKYNINTLAEIESAPHIFGQAETKLHQEIGRATRHIEGTAALKAEAEILYRYNTIGKDRMFRGIVDKKSNWNVILNNADTLQGKLDKLHRLFGERNAVTQMKQIGTLSEHLMTAEGYVANVQNLVGETADAWKNVLEKKGAKYEAALRKYHESKQLKQMVEEFIPTKESAMAIDKTIVDRRTLDAIEKQVGFKIDLQDIKMSNKTENVMRQLQRGMQEREAGVYRHTNWMSHNFNEVPHGVIENTDRLVTSVSKIGDAGIGYIPGRPTKEGKKIMNAAEYLAGENPSALGGGIPGFFRSRDMASKLAPEMILPVGESLSAYGLDYKNLVENRQLLSKLNDVKASLSVFEHITPRQTNIEGRTAVDLQFRTLADISDHINSIVGSRSSKAQGTMSKIMTPATDLLKTLTFVNKTAALSGRNLAIINSFQYASNNIVLDPTSLVKTMGSMFNYPMKLLLNKGNSQATLQSMIDGMKGNPMFHYNMNRYFGAGGHYPKLANAMNFGGEGVNTIMRKIANFATIGYQASDVNARVQMIKGATTHFQRALKKHQHKTSHNFVNSMLKELHYDALPQQTLSEITHALYRRENLGEASFIFAKTAIEKTLFNYGKWGRPQILDRIKTNPIMAEAAAFVSWPLYWTGTIKGALNAFKSGDKRPLVNMLGMSLAWTGTALALTDTGVDFVDDLANYGLYRSPHLSGATGLIGLSNRPLAGVGVGTISTLAFPLYKMKEYVSDGKGFTGLDSKDHWNNIKKMPAVRKAQQASDLWKTLNDIMED